MEVVILAAGKGARMYSNKPKVLHTIGGKSMLEHVLLTARRLGSERTHVVIGFGAGAIKAHFENREGFEDIDWVLQAEQLGTGHAVQQVIPNIDSAKANNRILVLFGDVPLVRAETLHKLLADADDDCVSLLTASVSNPSGLGRIIRKEAGDVTAIVEERDADEEQQRIREVNSGIMSIPATRLGGWLQAIGNENDQSEYYLTDLVALAAGDGCRIQATTVADELEVQGVNDKSQLALLERRYQMNKIQELLDQGVTLKDPARVDIRGGLLCGSDVEIDINVIFEGEVTLGDNVTIGPNCVIKDTTVAPASTVLSGSNIDGATIGEAVSIGPNARVRPGTVLKDQVRIGNFVETKNAVLGEGSKASHLAYIGDAEIGKNCNLGAGTIFCNYDGANKHKTTLGDNVFIGSNSVLVAPLSLADNAFVAAGSAINRDVPAANLAVGRGKQKNIDGWKRPGKNKK